MPEQFAEYQGLNQFGPAYRLLLENDPHPPGSVDRVLMLSMIRVCEQTAGYLYGPFTDARVPYSPGTRPVLESVATEIRRTDPKDEAFVEGVARCASRLSDIAPQGLDELKFGGSEEELLVRGSNWPTDVARVAAALFQVSGLPARIVYLADTDRPYSMHAIVEVRREDRWGAVDPLANVVYRWEDGLPAKVWDLMRNPTLLVAHYREGSLSCTKPSQFRAAAVANYPLGEIDRFNYSTGGVTDYYRPILEMADQGWPGGLRWLHAEDALLSVPVEALPTPARPA
ncbi:MAG: transglutaminase domain-containing protein [Thermoplasmata archaeon]